MLNKMWKAFINIKNFINGTDKTLYFPMQKIYRYNNLYNELLGKHYRASQIKFYFVYFEKIILIDDWTKYILNRDEIIIHIDGVAPMYNLIDSKTNTLLYHSENKKDVYEYYRKIEPFLKNAVIIKMNDSLLDVLDKGEYYLNSCINRLVHVYKF